MTKNTKGGHRKVRCSGTPVTNTTRRTAKAMLAPSNQPSLIP